MTNAYPTGRWQRFVPTSANDLGVAVLWLAGLGFTLQAPFLFAVYALRGFDTPPDDMPPLLRIDPLHGLVHLGLGLASLYAATRLRDHAVLATRFFGLVYLGLAFLGIATTFHLGLRLGPAENRFHLVVGGLILLVGLGAERITRRLTGLSASAPES